MTDAHDDGDAGDPPGGERRARPAPGDEARGGRPPSLLRSIVGAGAVVLVAGGLLLFSLAIPLLVDSDGVRCELARSAVEDANEDDDDWNDVELDEGQEAGDLPCEDAVALAETIPAEEDSDDTLSVPSESDVRTQGIISVVIGLGQAATGGWVLATGRRVARNVALVFTVTAILVPVFGILSLVMVAFVGYALAFSATSKDLWGSLNLLGGSRRPPRE